MNLHEIESILNSNSEEANERWLSIIRTTEVGRSTVSLFAGFGTASNERLELAGTGTLVRIGESHYILTAEHVWVKAFKFAIGLGISLRENTDHRYFMNIETIIPSGLRNDGSWNEWGPDIVFLRVPPYNASTIRVYREFHALDSSEEPRTDVDRIETNILVGTPHALGTFSQNHGHVEVVSFPVADVERHTRNGVDYVETKASLAGWGVANDLGGVSGGGLWRVQLFDSASEEIEASVRLEGVAFYQLEEQGDSRIIRCHGRESIRAAMPTQ
jgi:hypothetical protein